VAGTNGSDEVKAMEPEEVTQLIVELLNAGDAAGIAALYEPGTSRRHRR
jgi:hypothetical protein